MNLWCHRFSQNANQKLQEFLPYHTIKDRSTFFWWFFGECRQFFFGYDPFYFGRAEILVILGVHSERNDDLINSFWIELIFPTSINPLQESLLLNILSWNVELEIPQLWSCYWQEATVNAVFNAFSLSSDLFAMAWWE